MDIIKLFKEGWIVAINSKIDHYIEAIENNIIGELKDSYNAKNISFDRESKLIKFEIEFEEIEL